MRAPGASVAPALDALAAARGHLFPFAPVLMGLSIGLWFALPWEPRTPHYLAALAVAVAGLALRLRAAEGLHPLGLIAFWLALGFLSIGARAHLQAAPVLTFRYYGPVEGRIVEIDRSQSDYLRITLDRVRLDGLERAETPVRVRISLHGDDRADRIAPGLVVMLTANLSPPQPPAEPGAFDFRRMAWFERLGAVGYSRTPVLAVSEPDAAALAIDKLRARMSAAVQAHIPGQYGAFAAGATTGDRSAITQDTVAALRASNLAHLLAISGQNLVFLTAFVFLLVRTGSALVPPLALRIDAKKWAAIVAGLVAAFYLALSGGNVATERAFLMVLVMLGAVLLDRQAISMRSVAIAAMLLLLTKPEELLNPGFQMSMAATVVLVAGFRWLSDGGLRRRLPRWADAPATWVFSSVLASLATAPFGAAQFNRVTEYGLVANLLTVPSMGLLIMPGSVIAALLAPLGLGAPGYWMMHAGSWWILEVAHWVASWEGSVTGIPAPMPAVLPALTLGVLWVLLWPGRARLAGVLPCVVGAILWILTDRPPVLVSADAALTGVLGPGGRALSHARGAGFAAETWLERDGDLAAQAAAAERPGYAGTGVVRRVDVDGITLAHLKGRGAAAALDDACATEMVVVIAAEVAASPGPCLLLDRGRLAALGAVALWPDGDTVRVVASARPGRLWTGPAPRDGGGAADRLARAGPAIGQ